MWQRFTERSRRVVFFAQEEAGYLGESHVSTEHLLLGIVREHDNMAAKMLMGMGAEPDAVRAEVLKRVTMGAGRQGKDMQLTPLAKKIIDLAYEESKLLNNSYIGTEHLLLGMLREGEGLAGRVLNDMGIELEAARAIARELQATQGEEKPTEAKSLNIDSIKDTLQRLRETLLPAQAAPSVTAEDSNSSGSLLPTRGDIGVLRAVPERPQIEFITTEADIVEFDDVMRTRDEYAYRDMVMAGKIVLLDAGTSVKFLRSGQYGCWYARLLDGPQAGEVGYARRDTLQNLRPDDRPFPPPV